MARKKKQKQNKQKQNIQNKTGFTSTSCVMNSTQDSLALELDTETTKAMSECLLKMTTSGNQTLDDTELKKFKKYCRKSDDYVRYAYMLIMDQLEKKHAEIRLSAFQVAAELFTRSHAFRDILVTHLQDFLALTTGTETNQPMPPPKAAATRLKEQSLRKVQEWQTNFGKSYRKLDIGYNYLKNCKHIDFQNIQAQNEAERRRIEEAEKKKQKQVADRLAKALKHISENKSEIGDCIKEAENCLALLLPTPDDGLLFSAEDAQDSTIEERINSDQTSIVLKSSGENDSHCNKKILVDTEDVADKQTQDTGALSKVPSNLEIENTKKVATTSDDSHNQDGKKFSQVDGTPDSSRKSILSKEGVADDDSGDRIISGDDDDEDDSDDDEDDVDESGVCDRAHGFSKPGYSITIDMPVAGVKVKESEDNTDILQTLKDAAKLANSSFLPRVTKWLEILGKCGAKQDDIKAVIDLKLQLENIRAKCTDLNLVFMDKENPTSDDDDDDLEDVPEKEGYEASVPSTSNKTTSLPSPHSDKVSPPASVKRHRSSGPSTSTSSEPHESPSKKVKSSGNLWNLKAIELSGSVEDPTSRAAALAGIKSEFLVEENASATSSSSRPSSDAKSETSKAVPFVEFGKDLACWENPDLIEAPTIVKLDSLHRFWNSEGEKETEKASKHDMALVLNRTFNFTGEFEPVKWSCRAPLQSGKLCPRKDRIKCPFHGPIIPRDEDGSPSVKTEPTASTSTSADSTAETDSGLPPWLDPELQKEIEDATGHDLGSARSQKLLEKAMNKGKGKGKSKKKSGLTDIKAAENTSRKRLEKKIFNKATMKRVCSRLNTADYKRVRDKFGNQFNYSLSDNAWG